MGVYDEYYVRIPFVRPQLGELLLYYAHTIKPVDDVIYIFNLNLNLNAHTFLGYPQKCYLFKRYLLNRSAGYKLLSSIYDLLF